MSHLGKNKRQARHKRLLRSQAKVVGTNVAIRKERQMAADRLIMEKLKGLEP